MYVIMAPFSFAKIETFPLVCLLIFIILRFFPILKVWIRNTSFSMYIDASPNIKCSSVIVIPAIVDFRCHDLVFHFTETKQLLLYCY